MFIEAVSDRGKGPVLVYVPGIDGTGELLLTTATLLETRFRLIRLRYVQGMDKRNQTYAHLAESLVETVGLRGIESMLLLAESFGGAVAMQAALDFPDRVRGLLLVNTFPWFRDRLGLTLSRIGARVLPRWVLAWGRDHIAPRLLFGRVRDEETLAAFRAQHKNWTLDDGYRARLAMVGRLDLRSRLSEIDQPTILVTGSDDRIVDSVRQATEMQKKMPRASHETIEGGGHVILPLSEIDWVDYANEAHTAAVVSGRPGS